jgi:tRNA-Thr(GGU) m(6)t(6)A37 methyltransferase TsaA
MENISMKPIGVVRSCFTEKFGVPRQSMMVKEATGTIKLDPIFSPQTVLHLDGFSHLWVVYLFHKGHNENHPQPWTDTIQPPRIDAPKKVGVFASRSPHRPNPIGMSVVKLEKIILDAKDGIEIEISGLDILDGSPLLDLKPYIPYADLVQDSTSGWIKNEISRYPVKFAPEVELGLQDESIKKLISGILEWDPRPRSQREHSPIESAACIGKRFAFRLMNYDIHWVIESGASICVVEISTI